MTSGTVLAMIRHRIAAIAATTVAVLGIVGIGIAYASGTVNVPNANGQLTGPVSICVNTANEGQQYVELHHPAPGNCAAGYLQYTANQPAATASAPTEVTNSETFGATAAATWQLGLPPGSHVDSIASVKFLPAASTEPAITVAVSTLDNANGQFKLTFTGGAPVVADEVEITYNYSL